MNARPVLRDLSLQVPPGLNIVIGPNGSGKTSLIRAIAGLIPVKSGRILWRGQDVLSTKSANRAQWMAYLAQNPPVHWPLLVRHLVALGCPNSKNPPDAVYRTMDDCGVLHLADRRIDQISGGERARVLLARLLAANAEVLLVDEPTSSLDPARQLDMMKILGKQAKKGKTILCVLHDLPLAARFADNLILLDFGQIVCEGEPQTVLRSAEMQRVFSLKFNASGYLML